MTFVWMTAVVMGVWTVAAIPLAIAVGRAFEAGWNVD